MIPNQHLIFICRLKGSIKDGILGTRVVVFSCCAYDSLRCMIHLLDHAWNDVPGMMELQTLCSFGGLPVDL